MIKISDKKLDISEVIKEVNGSSYGAIVVFQGQVRDYEGESKINGITYEAYTKMAEKEISKILNVTKEKWGIKASVQHRVGKVPVGEASVVIATSAPHRKEAFEACEYIIDEIKKSAPIWKTGYEFQSSHCEHREAISLQCEGERLLRDALNDTKEKSTK